MNPIRNIYKVPKAQWTKWDKESKYIFNSLYSHMMDNMDLYLHPKQPALQPLHWKTTCWNAAWIAADILE
jgi:hypothetical protein